MSSTSSPSRRASEATSADSGEATSCSDTPTASATAATTAAGSVTRTRSTNHTPSRRCSANSSATLIASRVLPIPPGPIAVTSDARPTPGRAPRARRSDRRTASTGTGSTRRRSTSRRLDAGLPGQAAPIGNLQLAQQRRHMASTVRTEMNSASAICAFVRCRPIRAKDLGLTRRQLDALDRTHRGHAVQCRPRRSEPGSRDQPTTPSVLSTVPGAPSR